MAAIGATTNPGHCAPGMNVSRIGMTATGAAYAA